MSKPNWKDAPMWATYLAMDSTSIWYWHEHEPKQKYGLWNSTGLNSRSEDNYIMSADTLEKRP